eukprot:gene16852-22338_t
MYIIVLFLIFYVNYTFSKTVSVIGANGRTGRKIVNIALTKGWKVNAVTRSGNFIDISNISNSKNLNQVAGDITGGSYKQLTSSLKGSNAVIFAASASKEGGSPAQVDRDGLINVAKICIENKIPRLVVVSSGAVTKPFSPVYLFLNLFGGIMKAKIDGENAIKKLYASPDAKSLGYTIVRPGGLTEEPPKGVAELELNQGDDRSGRISRWDVASICVESIDAKDAFRTSLECYNKDTAQPLANVGLSNLFKRTNSNDPIAPTGKERRASSWSKLFEGLIADN